MREVQDLSLPFSADQGLTEASERCFYGPREFAERLGTSRGYIYNLIDGGLLRSLKLGGRRLIPSSELDRLTQSAEFDRG